MGAFLPAFLAFCLNCYGITVFREVREVAGPGPLISSYIFLFALFVILWDIRLYPKSLRKLWTSAHYCYQFLVDEYLMETIILDFWVPLEAAVLALLPKTGDLIEDNLQEFGFNVDSISDFLKSETAGFVFSYFLSCFFLLSALHVTRAIDLRDLEFGPKCFFSCIHYRIRKLLKKNCKHISCCTKRVKLDMGDCCRNSCGSDNTADSTIEYEDPCDNDN